MYVLWIYVCTYCYFQRSSALRRITTYMPKWEYARHRIGLKTKERNAMKSARQGTAEGTAGQLEAAQQSSHPLLLPPNLPTYLLQYLPTSTYLTTFTTYVPSGCHLLIVSLHTYILTHLIPTLPAYLSSLAYGVAVWTYVRYMIGIACHIVCCPCLSHRNANTRPRSLPNNQLPRWVSGCGWLVDSSLNRPH
ncbi:hypothetical protein F4859DRAFT_220769 [Xylaria cf. heliscus]|nr:hypothetical protein F4859DRAFT_220769 [Xylaria cf. heliscus]